ncbi:hypothetical protein KEM55_000897, partial [Ascosphaera atra]
DAYVTELTVTAEDPPYVKKAEKEKKSKDSEKAKKRKTADGVASVAPPKKIAMSSHLQFWSDRHAELHGIQRSPPNEDSSKAGEENDPATTSTGVPTRSYADPERLCCYLCMRQFKNTADINRHERLSDLHRSNLQNEAAVARALHKLSKQRPAQQSTEYRDRAKERRQVFGSSKTSKTTKPLPAAVAAAKRSRSPEPAKQPVMSKGASLLGKMGWSQGSGLGAQGTGVTAPVETDVYVQGVGLGAQGGKIKDAVEEAGRRTKGRYDDFLEKTREQARERYERMTKEEKQA